MTPERRYQLQQNQHQEIILARLYAGDAQNDILRLTDLTKQELTTDEDLGMVIELGERIKLSQFKANYHLDNVLSINDKLRGSE